MPLRCYEPVILTPGPAEGPPEKPVRLYCELARLHPDVHAAMIRETEDGKGAVWVQWRGTDMSISAAPWCVADAGDEACGMFAGHPPGHGFEVTDQPPTNLDTFRTVQG
ncbi:hypothetical protein C0Q99_01575 [Streptomyces albidoflavus]|nr:hypothetical protein C0Q99_01575 [Streptomyces albidoflavus]